MKNCKWCGAGLEITSNDRKFYERMAVPEPSLCPDCRAQRRLCFRNERVLYRRNCDLTGKPIISMYSPEKPYKVYEQKEWWSDKWDPMDFGRGLDFSRSFFEQFKELLFAVPKASLFNKNCEENCEYVNIEFEDKNCYMCFGGGFSENCSYGNVVIRSNDCFDCQKINSCELCYELIDSECCFQCCFSQNLQNCSDVMFCYDCQNCSNCFGCTNLRNKRFYFLNEECTEEEYFTRLEKIQASSFQQMEELKNLYLQKILPNAIHRYARILNSEGCTGNYITNSKDCQECFEIDQSRDLKYVILAESLQDSMDCYISGWPAELCYESMSQCVNAYHNRFCNFCWEGVRDLTFCDHCFSCQDCFGCVGLRHKRYCILNRQYSKDQYEALIPKIIEHMKETAEWGEFFSVELSPFAYNETVASEYYPLSKEQVLKRGWKWKEAVKPNYGPEIKKITAAMLPDNSKDIPDDILNWAIECAESKRLFRIQRNELEFYRNMNLPVPRLHPDIRHQKRMDLRNPRKLWKRNCVNCGKDLQTSYAPTRKEIIFCEECYLQKVF